MARRVFNSRGISVEEQRKAVAEYQAKWREESASWNEFESRITRKDEQVFGISDATLAMQQGGPVALKLCGHLNYATYHEVYLRLGRSVFVPGLSRNRKGSW